MEREKNEDGRTTNRRDTELDCAIARYDIASVVGLPFHLCS